MAGIRASAVAWGLTKLDDGDQRQPSRTNELAEIAGAIGQSYAAGAQPRRPYLCHVWPDDRIAAATKKLMDHDHQIEHREAAEEQVVPITGEGRSSGKA
jgi:hypothetical protein